MIKLYSGPHLIAEQDKDRSDILNVIHGNTKQVPTDLIQPDTKTISYWVLLDWVKQRVFPHERLDRERLLGYLGLEEYDKMQIAFRTGAMTVSDPYWVDWDIPQIEQYTWWNQEDDE